MDKTAIMNNCQKPLSVGNLGVNSCSKAKGHAPCMAHHDKSQSDKHMLYTKEQLTCTPM
jgi:hypothetical protein